MDGNALTIEQEVSRWPGVTTAPGRFGAVAFRYGKREIGYLHRDRIADLPVTTEMREDLLAKDRARPYRAGVKGYVSYPVQDPEDVSVVIEVLGRNIPPRPDRRRTRRQEPRRKPERYGERSMSEFTLAEIEYLRGQQLGRLATVNETGDPHVVPVSFRYNEELDTIDIGGHNLGKSKKFRDATKTGRAAFVVDDVLPPWQARGVEVRGRAEVFGEGGDEVNPDFDADLIRLHPTRIVGWGIDTDPYRPSSRSVSREA